MVYLENFAQHDFEKYCSNNGQQSTVNTANNSTCTSPSNQMMTSYPLRFDDLSQTAYLSFDLFNWLDRNLKQSQRYQDRQIYVDMLAIFVRLLFRDSIEWRESLPNHYLVDLVEHCPSLMDWSELSYRFSKRYRLNLKELHSSQFFAMLMIQRYRLLHQLTELATKDRVSTIRTSACIVLYTLLQCANHWVVNHLHQIPITSINDCCIPKTNMTVGLNISAGGGSDSDHSHHQLTEMIMDYYDTYMDNATIISDHNDLNSYNSIAYFTSEQLYLRRQYEQDRIVLEELHKVYTLVDDIRLDFSLNYYQLRNKRKKPRKQLQQRDEMIPSPTPSITSIDSSVIELINELMLSVENDVNSSYLVAKEKDDGGILKQVIERTPELLPEEDEGIDLVNDSSVLITDDSATSSTLSSPTIDTTTTSSLDTANNQSAEAESPSSSSSPSITSRGLIYLANVNELVADSNELSSISHTTVAESSLPTGNNRNSLNSIKSSNLNSLHCSPKKRKSPKHHEQQTINHRSASNLSIEKHLNTIIKHNSNIQQPNVPSMISAKTNSSSVNKSGYKGNHQGIIPCHNNNKLGVSSSSKKKTSILTSHHHQQQSNRNNNGIALLPTPTNTTNVAHCGGSKVPVLSNRSNNNYHHQTTANNNRALLQHGSNITNNNNNITPNTANCTASSMSQPSSPYPGYCFRIVYPQTGRSLSNNIQATNSSAQFYSGSIGQAAHVPHHNIPSSLSSPGINNNNNNDSVYQQQQQHYNPHNYHHNLQNKIPAKINSATIPYRAISHPHHQHQNHHPQAGLLHQPSQTKSSSSKWHNHNCK